jgi:hypothetical protein
MTIGSVVGRRLGFPKAVTLHHPPQSVLISIGRPLHGAAEGFCIEGRPTKGGAVLGPSTCYEPVLADIDETQTRIGELP